MITFDGVKVKNLNSDRIGIVFSCLVKKGVPEYGLKNKYKFKVVYENGETEDFNEDNFSYFGFLDDPKQLEYLESWVESETLVNICESNIFEEMRKGKNPSELMWQELSARQAEERKARFVYDKSINLKERNY